MGGGEESSPPPRPDLSSLERDAQVSSQSVSKWVAPFTNLLRRTLPASSRASLTCLTLAQCALPTYNLRTCSVTYILTYSALRGGAAAEQRVAPGGPIAPRQARPPRHGRCARCRSCPRRRRCRPLVL